MLQLGRCRQHWPGNANTIKIPTTQIDAVTTLAMTLCCVHNSSAYTLNTPKHCCYNFRPRWCCVVWEELHPPIPRVRASILARAWQESVSVKCDMGTPSASAHSGTRARSGDKRRGWELGSWEAPREMWRMTTLTHFLPDSKVRKHQSSFDQIAQKVTPLAPFLKE